MSEEETVFTFPTKRTRGPSSYIATIIKVYEGFNANYGPKGRDGLYLKVKFESSGNLRDIFYPSMPSMKSDRLLKALEELEFDLDKVGWQGLTNYTLRFVTEQANTKWTDKATGEKVNRTVQLEFPAEIVRTPEENDAAPDMVTTSGIPEASNNGTGDYEAFKDEIVNIVAGKDDGAKMNEIRLAAAQSEAVREAPPEFREKLNKGVLVAELVDEGRLSKEGEIFKITL